MNSNWDNFLQNLGEWQGSFTDVSITGELQNATPSLLSLTGSENNKLVRFRIQRYGAEGYSSTPVSDYEQEYRSIGRQNIFFDTGAFAKGTLQLAPCTEFGAEYGFVQGDRRWRCVQLFDTDHNFINLVLIREFRSGTAAVERPPLTVDQLFGKWDGQAVTAYADWQNPDHYATSLEINRIDVDRLEQKLSWGNQTITTSAQIEGNRLRFQRGKNLREILLLPDGGSSNVPLQIQRHEPFFVEAGWLVTDTERQRLIRHYSAKGEWISATHVIERKIS
jgi:hypothetical protein